VASINAAGAREFFSQQANFSHWEPDRQAGEGRALVNGGTSRWAVSRYRDTYFNFVVK
jgi:hypothetical protein